MEVIQYMIINQLESKLRSIGIIGASGFLGGKLYSDLRLNANVVGTYNSNSKPGLVKLDIALEEEVKAFFEKYKFDILLIPGGITYPDVCENNKEEANRANVIGIKNIMKYCNCKIIYFSTDYVFDGKIGKYSEYDALNPVNYYGYTKVEAEKVIMSHDNNVVLRVSGLYGTSELNNDFVKSLYSNPVIYKSDDNLSCNLLVDDVTKNLDYFIGKSGIFHLTDACPISKYEFTKMAVEILEIDSKVLPKPAKELYKFAMRPRDTSLISKRHDLCLRGPREGLTYLKKLLQNDDEGGCRELLL